jgi:hypothetical protein
MKHMQNAPAAPSLKNLSRVAGASRTYYRIAEVAQTDVPANSADHFVMFYEADSFLVDGVVDFIGPALRSSRDAGGAAVSDQPDRAGPGRV